MKTIAEQLSNSPSAPMRATDPELALDYLEQRFSAPKGHPIVAQGNALGLICPRFRSPERAA